MNHDLDAIQKIAEILFYTVSTAAVVKKAWFSGKKKHNGSKKKRKH